MASKKSDRLKSLIQKVELDEPTTNFTALVMEEVEAQNEVVVNPSLKLLLKRSGIEKPAANFTDSIMTRVEAQDYNTAYKPIISNRVWRIIIVAAVLFLLWLGFTRQASSSDGLTPYFINIGNVLNAIFANVSSIPPLYAITIVSLSALLVMDYLIKIRSQSHEKRSRRFSQ